MRHQLVRYASVALLLVGSAILLYSCGEEAATNDPEKNEALMTEFSENLTIIESENGRKSYHFTTKQLEGYMMAKDPYREFRKGVDIVTFKDDSISSVDATLTANYAIHYSKRDLWEAKGNVVVEAAGGERTLYTQQLFWNVKTKRIFSNVDSKIVFNNGKEEFYGEGFESDDAMTDWRFRRLTGRMEFEMRNREDSVAAHKEIASGEASPAAQAKRRNQDAAEEAKRAANERARDAKKPPAANFNKLGTDKTGKTLLDNVGPISSRNPKSQSRRPLPTNTNNSEK